MQIAWWCIFLYNFLTWRQLFAINYCYHFSKKYENVLIFLWWNVCAFTSFLSIHVSRRVFWHLGCDWTPRTGEGKVKRYLIVYKKWRNWTQQTAEWGNSVLTPRSVVFNLVTFDRQSDICSLTRYCCSTGVPSVRIPGVCMQIHYWIDHFCLQSQQLANQ